MKTALIFGSSGLIGSNILNILINDTRYNKILLFVRTKPNINNSKIEIIDTDFSNLDLIKEKIKGDDCFFCIGTTHKDTPDKIEYRRIEYELPVNLAKIAKFNSVKNFIYVSSIGANANSSSTYLKNKGQTEEELKQIGFSKLSIVRPSFLIGNRETFRIGEFLGIPIMKFLSLFFFGGLKKYSPIRVEKVARAMIKIASEKYSQITFLSDKLEELGKKL